MQLKKITYIDNASYSTVTTVKNNVFKNAVFGTGDILLKVASIAADIEALGGFISMEIPNALTVPGSFSFENN